jgi:hypothetical protein
MMLSGPEPTEPMASVSARFSDRRGSGTRSGPKPKSRPEPASFHHEFDGDHADSSAASTSSGEIDCEMVDNNSSEEEIDEKSHESALVSNQLDPSSSSQSVPSSAPTETGSGKAISNYFIF